jgi:adenylosuccinate lyase
MMKRHLMEELPFIATENIMMYCVKNKGGDRQALHEAIRQHSVDTAKQIKAEPARRTIFLTAS